MKELRRCAWLLSSKWDPRQEIQNAAGNASILYNLSVLASDIHSGCDWSNFGPRKEIHAVTALFKENKR